MSARQALSRLTTWQEHSLLIETLPVPSLDSHLHKLCMDVSSATFFPSNLENFNLDQNGDKLQRPEKLPMQSDMCRKQNSLPMASNYFLLSNKGIRSPFKTRQGTNQRNGLTLGSSLKWVHTTVTMSVSMAPGQSQREIVSF